MVARPTYPRAPFRRILSSVPVRQYTFHPILAPYQKCKIVSVAQVRGTHFRRGTLPARGNARIMSGVPCLREARIGGAYGDKTNLPQSAVFAVCGEVKWMSSRAPRGICFSLKPREEADDSAETPSEWQRVAFVGRPFNSQQALRQKLKFPGGSHATTSFARSVH